MSRLNISRELLYEAARELPETRFAFSTEALDYAPAPSFPQEWEQEYRANHVPDTMYGPTFSPEEAMKMCRDSFAVTSSPLPTPESSVGAEDLLFEGPASTVKTVDGKGRPMGGRLRLFANKYNAVDPWLAQQLKEGYNFVRDGCEMACVFFKNHPSCSKNESWLEKELAALLLTDCCAVYTQDTADSHGAPRVSCALHVEESSGKNRFIWDARPVINIDRDGTVKYEALSDFAGLLKKGTLCFKTDAASGYFQVPMSAKCAPYLCFSWKGTLFYWKVLPFGLRSAPAFFERCTATMKGDIRSGMKGSLLGYLDDFLFGLHAREHAEATREREELLQKMMSWGWVLGKLKTTDPSTQTEVLGFLLDTELHMLFVSKKRQLKFFSLHRHLSCLAEDAGVKARTVAKMAGYLNSMEAAVWYAQRLAYPFLYCLRDVAREQEWFASVTLSADARLALSLVQGWWEWAHGKPLIPEKPEIDMATDSSSFARSGFIAPACEPENFLCMPVTSLKPSSTVHAMWRDHEALHINWKELVSVLETCKALTHTLASKRFRLSIDNTVAAAYARKGGGCVTMLARVAWEMTKVLVRCRARLTEVRIVRSEENLTADEISRTDTGKDEWTLTPAARTRFQQWREKQGLPQPTIDAFASKYDAMLPRYVSRFADDGAEDTDFFVSEVVEREGEVMWCHPPWTMMSKVVKSILARKLKAYVLFPCWTRKIWFPFLNQAEQKLTLWASQSPLMSTITRPRSSVDTRFSCRIAWIDGEKHAGRTRG